jgi:nickel superoxide dismutase
MHLFGMMIIADSRPPESGTVINLHSLSQVNVPKNNKTPSFKSMKVSRIAQLAFVLSLASAPFTATQTVNAHCQVPCGIYNDSARVEAMLEDAATITKATMMLAELEGQTETQAIHQTTRWVLNKEQHAQNIIDTISDYFLTQRINPSQADYKERLVKHHTVILAAMQAKQNSSATYATDLTASIKSLSSYYPAHTH